MCTNIGSYHNFRYKQGDVIMAQESVKFLPIPDYTEEEREKILQYVMSLKVAQIKDFLRNCGFLYREQNLSLGSV